MNLALKYGLLITLVVVVWVLVTHLLVPLAPESQANVLAPILFNLAAIVAIYLGIKSRTDETTGITFKEGIKTGLGISLVYAISTSLFFFILFLIVGPTLMANEPLAPNYPVWKVALGAFAGMFLGSLILGLVYSTIVSFFLAKRTRTV